MTASMKRTEQVFGSVMEFKRCGSDIFYAWASNCSTKLIGFEIVLVLRLQSFKEL